MPINNFMSILYFRAVVISFILDIHVRRFTSVVYYSYESCTLLNQSCTLHLGLKHLTLHIILSCRIHFMNEVYSWTVNICHIVDFLLQLLLCFKFNCFCLYCCRYLKSSLARSWSTCSIKDIHTSIRSRLSGCLTTANNTSGGTIDQQVNTQHMRWMVYEFVAFQLVRGFHKVIVGKQDIQLWDAWIDYC